MHGVEVHNASRKDEENDMAKRYAQDYGLIEFAGSDNHSADKVKRLGGMMSETPVKSEDEFIKGVMSGDIKYFYQENPLILTE